MYIFTMASAFSSVVSSFTILRDSNIALFLVESFNFSLADARIFFISLFFSIALFASMPSCLSDSIAFDRQLISDHGCLREFRP